MTNNQTISNNTRTIVDICNTINKPRKVADILSMQTSGIYIAAYGNTLPGMIKRLNAADIDTLVIDDSSLVARTDHNLRDIQVFTNQS